ncbi:hypothetical protein N9263_00250 [Candidatus Marinimicrobia bacterium]|nr:hypothetical protein [Candidatus Neomarinimicrobiota bacterium]
MISFAPKFLRAILAIYLALFFSSCAPHQVSIEEARQIQTHVFSVSIQATMDAVITALQDQLYMIDDVNSNLNIIMASRITDKKLADTVIEMNENDVPLWVKITGIAFFIAIIGFIIYSFSGNDSDEGDECTESSHNHCNHEHNHYDLNLPDHDFGIDRAYRYQLNVNLSEAEEGGTKVRIIAQGEYLEDGNIVRAGAIQDPVFYNRIFMRIDNIIFE